MCWNPLELCWNPLEPVGTSSLGGYGPLNEKPVIPVKRP